MSLIGLAFDISAAILVGVTKVVWYGGKYIIYGRQKTPEESLRDQIQLMDEKLNRLTEQLENKKLRHSV